jgi:NADPH:quinone reductase
VFLTRPHLWDYTATAEEIDRRAGDLFKWVADGRLKVTIDRQFRLGEAKAAHDALEGRQSKGKLILGVEEAV